MRMPFLIGWGVTILWMVLVGSYVDVEIGWGNLFTFLPRELGGFVIGTVTPPTFLWLVIAFLFRESEIAVQSKTLLLALRDITNPTEEPPARTRAMLDDLRKAADELKASSLLASQSASELVETLDRQVEVLNKVSADVAKRTVEVGRQLQSQTQDLEKTVQMVSSASKDVEDSFQRQVEGLISASDEAAAQAKNVTESAFGARRDSFLRASSFIIEKLNSLAIDVNRLLGTSISEAAWDRFLKGDKGIFARLLYGKGYMETNRRIRERFKNDKAFRKYVMEYMSEFKGLLGHARTLDHSNVLESTFLSADVGKLYLLLEHSLEDGS